jgi:hypothetical protein
MECQYCKKTYSNIYNLSNHQRTTKSCLILQNKLDKKTAHECSFCGQAFSTRANLNRHMSICKQKLIIDQDKKNIKIRELEEQMNLKSSELQLKDDKIKELEVLRLKDEKIRELEEKLKEDKIKELEARLKDEKIKELEEKLKERERDRERPQKVSNKTINKNIDTQHIDTQHIDTQNITNHITIYQVMTPEHVLEVFQKNYNLDTLLGGQKALARFVNEEFLKEQATPLYVCGDRSRQKFYMVKDGKKEEDPDCEHIIGLSSPGLPHVRDVYEDALFTTHQDITEEQIQENYRTITNMDKDRTQFKSELSKVINELSSNQSTPWQKAVEQLKTMRENILPYENKNDIF